MLLGPTASPRQGPLRGRASGGPAGRHPTRPPSSRDRWWRGASGRTDLHEIPLFVHQLAGLLKAGRPPSAPWAGIETVYAASGSAFGNAVLPRLAPARRAADLGLSVPEALRQSAGPTGGVGGSDALTRGTARLWADLAACLEISERSGAPLAGILEHYAGQADAGLGGAPARATAPAGPRATVLPLAWLPAVGLVLAFALGINPLTVLLGTGAGRLALAAGILLMVIARMWSTRLGQHATGVAPRASAWSWAYCWPPRRSFS
ncbi:hypothetical protein AC792_14420 [Arthrobacter sp. RIT-PI-e]|nr:hypothetical protein AC792_14420 [Arthrobacter sp. RIT-PI-e]